MPVVVGDGVRGHPPCGERQVLGDGLGEIVGVTVQHPADEPCAGLGGIGGLCDFLAVLHVFGDVLAGAAVHEERDLMRLGRRWCEHVGDRQASVVAGERPAEPSIRQLGRRPSGGDVVQRHTGTLGDVEQAAVHRVERGNGRVIVAVGGGHTGQLARGLGTVLERPCDRQASVRADHLPCECAVLMHGDPIVGGQALQGDLRPVGHRPCAVGLRCEAVDRLAVGIGFHVRQIVQRGRWRFEREQVFGLHLAVRAGDGQARSGLLGSGAYRPVVGVSGVDEHPVVVGDGELSAMPVEPLDLPAVARGDLQVLEHVDVIRPRIGGFGHGREAVGNLIEGAAKGDALRAAGDGGVRGLLPSVRDVFEGDAVTFGDVVADALGAVESGDQRAVVEAGDNHAEFIGRFGSVEHERVGDLRRVRVLGFEHVPAAFPVLVVSDAECPCLSRPAGEPGHVAPAQPVDGHVLGAVVGLFHAVDGQAQGAQLVRGVHDVGRAVEPPAVLRPAVLQEVVRAHLPGEVVHHHAAIDGPSGGHVVYLHLAVHGVGFGIRVVGAGIVRALGRIEAVERFPVHSEPCARRGGGSGCGQCLDRVYGLCGECADAVRVGCGGDAQQHGYCQGARQQNGCFPFHVHSHFFRRPKEEGACPA